MKEEIRNRKALSMAALNKLWKLWEEKTWSLTKTDESALNSFTRRLLRRAVGIFWPDKIKPEELYKKTGTLELSQTIAYRRHTLLGHILRLNIEAPAQKAMDNYYMSTAKPLPVRPKTILPAVLKKDLKARNLSLVMKIF